MSDVDSLFTTLTSLINRMDSTALSRAAVIKWGCPVPVFGNLWRSRVATLGLNPSNREFVDDSGNELEGASRRFPTLRSLGLESWCEVDVRHMRIILDSCRGYFASNPYDRWFRRLDYIIAGTETSFYDQDSVACHLDLIPYATELKWTELTTAQRRDLIVTAGDALGLLLRNAPVRVLILNGRSVVDHFESIAGVQLEREVMPQWSLRRPSSFVDGIAYNGVVENISGVSLGYQLAVFGFNHNLQSSFGVTREVVDSIRNWIAGSTRNMTYATTRSAAR